MEVKDFLPSIITPKKLNIYFVTASQYRLGIEKLKNVFRSFLTHSNGILKIFYLVEFSTDWLTDWLTDCLTDSLPY